MDATTRLAASGNYLLGCWLITAAFVFAASGIARWNDVLVGTVVAIVAGYNYASVRSRRPASVTGAGLIAILGCWLVVAPFALGPGLEGPALWNDVVTGTVMAGFGGYNAYVAAAAERAPLSFDC
ncbi:SPW repeat-containing protein [Halobiforma haloterrestris]|uniref:SPW repeat-containing protein n=1 Tax=Natronobacterium haloterrestre TaxID=148448 RepID=A0A1I1JU96_NATHA|nr:SPW repeat protein [Halobiforma haloterrestris]SFC51532.1 SPW repeat-containing protein [Halobiforma haloterrestris]